MSLATYDRIGIGYSNYRRPDRRIAANINRALGASRTIVNVGAGAGSYEPIDRAVIAIEPSAEMIRQRAPTAAAVIRACADRLPFRDGTLEAALAILTIHHWSDWRRGLNEMRRVAQKRIVALTWDPDHSGFWLVQDYFPELLEVDRPAFPQLHEIESEVGPMHIEPVPIPFDCSDGFLGAYWRRPEAYLDAGARGAISTFSKLNNLEPGLKRLERDLETGTWRDRYESLLALSELDIGYRIIIASYESAEDSAPEAEG